MPQCDSQTKEIMRPAVNGGALTSATKTKQKQTGEMSKEDREQALAECRKRCGIVPGQMKVLKDPSLLLDKVEQPWMKWTPEIKEKAFQKFRERAGIIPHRKQVPEATVSAATPATGTRDQVAYVPKPTQTPSAPQRNSNDSDDTHMTEGTVEEEKKSTQPNRTSEHVTKRAKRVKRDGEEDN